MNEILLMVIVAAAFAVVTGANDGATLVAINVPNPAIPPMAATMILAGAVVVVPLLGGARVAETLARGLVSFEGRGGTTSFLGAVLVALGVVLLLTRRGLPTSLTLALLGAIVGTGIGRGLPVSWPTVGAVLLVGLMAPAAAMMAGLVAAQAFARSPVRGHAWTELRVLGAASYLLQSIAYGANDGQKMLAIVAMAVGLGPGGHVVVGLETQLLLGGLFMLGTLIGIERFAGRLGRGIFAARAIHAVASELGSASSVLVSAAIGAPVSMTQASTAALIGAGVSETRWRVRWEQAVRIAAAWIVTLPATALAGGAVSIALRAVA